MSNPFANRRVSRREFLRYAEIVGFSALAAPILAACAQSAPAGTTAEATSAPAAEAPAEGATVAEGLKEVAREKTFIPVRGGTQGKFTEWDQWNPFVPVANHQFAVGLMYEPLAF